jgi:hypothetical protein
VEGLGWDGICGPAFVVLIAEQIQSLRALCLPCRVSSKTIGPVFFLLLLSSRTCDNIISLTVEQSDSLPNSHFQRLNSAQRFITSSRQGITCSTFACHVLHVRLARCTCLTSYSSHWVRVSLRVVRLCVAVDCAAFPSHLDVYVEHWFRVMCTRRKDKSARLVN